MKQQNPEHLREQALGNKEVNEMISKRAYEIHVSRGGDHGRDIEDWLQAEREVLASLSGEGPLTECPDSPRLVSNVTEVSGSASSAMKESKSSAAPRTRKD